MNILVITPAPAGSTAGNRATAERWAALLENAGHQVEITTAFRSGPYELVIALHAWRSHADVLKARAAEPLVPLIVALTGTDIYDHQHRYPAQTLQSMASADCLIGLHRQVCDDIPREFSAKLVTVMQSAATPAVRPSRQFHQRNKGFLVSVIGHLREEKDSLRTACASRLLPPESRVEVVAAGRAHSQDWAERANLEQSQNDRFRWLGELNRENTMSLMVSSQVMVISSLLEGGANVVSEACRAGTPIIASDIAGNRGLLGDDYPGYFPPGDETALAALLLRAEEEPDFLDQLRRCVSAIAPAFTPGQEQQALLEAVRMAQANASR